MGLCKTSNFSIFTFINVSNLKFCSCSYSSCVYHMMRFKGSNGKVCSIQLDTVTAALKKLAKHLWLSQDGGSEPHEN